MDIRTVINNIKLKGLSETWKIFKQNRRKNDFNKEYIDFYTARPFLDMPEDERRQYLDMIFEKEKELQKSNPAGYKKYLWDMKEVYIKERIPEIYKKAKDKPVEDKVIFMESGTVPSPSNKHISQVMKKEGKYEVHMTGLQIRKVSFVEFYENALKFIENLGTAKALFLSTANELLSHIDIRPETKVIQLWHGVGIFKKVGYSTLKSKNFGSNSAKLRKQYDKYKNYSYVTIASEEQSWIFEDAMHINKDSGIIAPVGVARTDVFYDKSYIERAYNKLYKEFPNIKGKKIILYAPTFRGEVTDAQAPDKLDINAFAQYLKDEYVLLIKHHGVAKNVPDIPEELNNTFAFDIGKSKALGIEGLLAVADICITDYSSIAFEYAIMEKPIVFFAYDLEEYIDDRGMYYNYSEITPGPICKTNEEMINYILNIDTMFNKQEVIDFKNKYVNACDGHATERTIALIEDKGL